jgi:hypothetical protein
MNSSSSPFYLSGKQAFKSGHMLNLMSNNFTFGGINNSLIFKFIDAT